MKKSLKVIACMAALAILVGVQSAKAAADQEFKIPNLIKLSGTAKDPNGLPKAGTLQIKFGLYASKEGGDVLWNETQVVTTDAEGNYSVYLGASEEKGLPLELFSAEKARWLGVQVEGDEEQARVLFVAVPYALKALDAETVGGKSLSSFVLYEDLEKLAEDSAGQGGEATDEDGNTTTSNRTAGAINLLKSTSLHGGDRERSMQAVINGTGVANALAKFSDSENITASVLSEVSGNIGVGTLSPYAKLTFAYDSTTTDPIAMMDSAVGGRNWRFGGGVGAPGAFTIRDDTAGANRFSIFSNGNIGVGTASPIAKFSFEYDSSVVDPIAMTDTAVGGRSWRLGGGVGAAGTFTIRDDTAGANRLSISSGGNVGIGTTSPSSKLTVAGDIESSTGFRIGGSTVFSVAGTSNTFLGSGAGQANTTGQQNTASGSQALQNNTTGSYNTASGNFALYSNTGGSFNTAAGYATLYANTTGSRNTASGRQALYANTTGQDNTASGALALYANTTGQDNTASGSSALQSNTTGYSNTASGAYALQSNTTGNSNTASGASALVFNTTGVQNMASGSGALYSNTTGFWNTASGYNALYFNTTGYENTASGRKALYSNTTGYNNTASGVAALFENTTGYNNTASGYGALSENTTGYKNTASGYNALNSNTTGNLNTSLGDHAGYSVATGSNNIHINNEGDIADSNAIRIGIVTPTINYPNAHTQTFIAGIANATVSGSTVVIDSNGQLGIATSSRRFKEDIRDMGDASSSLLQLRPVTFHYKPEYSKSAPSLQYGLIAEEVAEVYPDLVQYDKDGKPFTVQYQVLNSMLLNEVQKQHAALERKDSEISELRQQIKAMREDKVASDTRLSALERIMNRLMTQTSENREGK